MCNNNKKSLVIVTLVVVNVEAMQFQRRNILDLVFETYSDETHDE